MISVALIVILYSSLSFAATLFSSGHHGPRSVSELRYSTAHSLGDGYEFNVQDGWQTINITNLPYKYSNISRGHGGRAASHADNLQRRSKKPKESADDKAKSDSIGDTVKETVKNVFKGLKGLGKPEPVTITWYTGHDLQNPSCWSESDWAPTDSSFACALTLDGWQSKPQCFKFLELCNSPKKCVFVRVVDTCAGCAAGSKHVDLTRAAFGQLADFAEGVLTVNMRMATEPDEWHNNLWGPKSN
ncbi:hypothetical protein DENSPDRAFT_830979 [Dentipellis sp. KUC8613]|nr:hypothetical protein DENSPDRAFT_830979 [Dentipellis sp. KUC8613]